MDNGRKKNFSLCSPRNDVSCFRCCPPIRPRNYDHVMYVSSMKRLIRENTLRFKKNGPEIKPITGFFCWALGYIDKKHEKIGCMLHPLVNDGRDLRYMINYGNKCARENCIEAIIFTALSEKCKRFWLEVTEGLNSFYYSSNKANPIFHILNWGVANLEFFYQYASKKGYSCTELLWKLPFLVDRKVDPKKWRLPIKLLYESGKGISLEKFHWIEYINYFQKVFAWKKKMLISESKNSKQSVYVHLIGLDEDLSCFIRFFGEYNKISPENADIIYRMAKETTFNFLEEHANENFNRKGFA